MAASPNDLTRQQLDELDALLQRMLSPTQTQTEARQNGWRADPPASVGTPHLAEEPALAVAELPASRVAESESSAITAPMPRQASIRLAPQPTTSNVASLEVAPIDLAILTPADAHSKANPKSLPERGSLVLWPLAAINWFLESVLKLFGPPGEILTRRAGKNLLGMIGILLLLAACCWTAHTRGWIALPLNGLFGR